MNRAGTELDDASGDLCLRHHVAHAVEHEAVVRRAGTALEAHFVLHARATPTTAGALSFRLTPFVEAQKERFAPFADLRSPYSNADPWGEIVELWSRRHAGSNAMKKAPAPDFPKRINRPAEESG